MICKICTSVGIIGLFSWILAFIQDYDDVETGPILKAEPILDEMSDHLPILEPEPTLAEIPEHLGQTTTESEATLAEISEHLGQTTAESEATRDEISDELKGYTCVGDRPCWFKKLARSFFKTFTFATDGDFRQAKIYCNKSTTGRDTLFKVDQDGRGFKSTKKFSDPFVITSISFGLYLDSGSIKSNKMIGRNQGYRRVAKLDTRTSTGKKRKDEETKSRIVSLWQKKILGEGHYTMEFDYDGIYCLRQIIKRILSHGTEDEEETLYRNFLEFMLSKDATKLEHKDKKFKERFATFHLVQQELFQLSDNKRRRLENAMGIEMPKDKTPITVAEKGVMEVRAAWVDPDQGFTTPEDNVVGTRTITLDPIEKNADDQINESLAVNNAVNGGNRIHDETPEKNNVNDDQINSCEETLEVNRDDNKTHEETVEVNDGNQTETERRRLKTSSRSSPFRRLAEKIRKLEEQ